MSQTPKTLLSDLMLRGNRVVLHPQVVLRFENKPVDLVDCQNLCCWPLGQKSSSFKPPQFGGKDWYLQLCFGSHHTSNITIQRNTHDVLEFCGSRVVKSASWLMRTSETRLTWHVALRRNPTSLCQGTFIYSYTHSRQSRPCSGSLTLCV